MFTDKVLTCTDCKQQFIFTAGEQEFFHSRNFANDPKRCKACKRKRQGGDAAHRRPLTETVVFCESCTRETTVPFKPVQGKPVLCRACFEKARVYAQSR